MKEYFNKNFNELYYSQLIENVDIAIIAFNESGYVTKANSAVESLFGLSIGDLLGLHVSDKKFQLTDLNGDDISLEQNPFNRAIIKGIITDKAVYGINNKNFGNKQWFTISFFRGYLDKTFKTIQILAVITDVTSLVMSYLDTKFKKNIQDVLIAISSNFINIPIDKYDEIINQSLEDIGTYMDADRVYIFDYDFQKMTASNTYEWCAKDIIPQINELQNYPVNNIPEWIDKHVNGIELVIDDVLSLKEENNVRKILEPQGIKSIITVPIMSNDKCIGFLGLDAVKGHFTYTDSHRELLGIFAKLYANLWQRYKDIKDLDENRKFLSDLIQNSGSLIAIKDLDGRYEFVNKIWEKTTGLTVEKTLGRTDFELFDFEIAEQFFKNDQQVLKKKKSIKFEEYTIERGIKNYFIASKFPVFNSTGKITGLCAMITDMTEQKKAESYKMARKQAEAESNAKSIFLSNVTHEIRTPLHAIISYSHLLNSDTSLSEDQYKKVSAINRNSEHLLTLIDDILDYSKIEAKRMDLNISQFNLYNLIKNIESMFNISAEQKQLSFEIYVGKNVPKTIKSDEKKIKQILVNILSNAIKFTNEGGVKFHINIGKDENKKIKYILFKVIDTGLGIKSKSIQEIFKPFKQIRINNTDSGTGLGLPISKELSDLLGGRLSISSKEGIGTKATLLLPFDNNDYQKNSETELISAEEFDNTINESIRVLIVEDNDDIRDTITEMLENSNIQSFAFNNCTDALKKINHIKPDIILTDIRLPVMSGYDFISHIKKDVKIANIPIIVTSASLNEIDSPKFSHLGINAFLIKPFTQTSFIKVIHGVHLNENYINNQISEMGNTDLTIFQNYDKISILKLFLLRDAVEMGEISKMKEIINDLSKTNPISAKLLDKLVDKYEYEKIMNMINYIHGSE